MQGKRIGNAFTNYELRITNYDFGTSKNYQGEKREKKS